MARMSADNFQVTGRAGTTANVYILAVKGAITYSTSRAFQEAAKEVPAPALIVDLSEVPSVDSMAIGSLVRVYVSCNKTGRKLALVGLNPRVKSVMQLTGLGPLFDVYGTVSEAEAALS